MVNYVLGVLLAIIGGMANFSGQVLQKKVVNGIPKEQRNKDMMKTLVKNPLWITGFLLMFILSAIFIMSAQGIIGAALIPGLTASGLIILAIGSVKVIGEQLKRSEIIGILLIIAAVTCIGLSELSIEGSMNYFNDLLFNTRLTIFSIAFIALWISSIAIGRRRDKNKTIFLSLGAGFPFVLSNAWLQPLIVSITSLASGYVNAVVIVVFIVSAVVEVLTGFIGLVNLQEAFREGNASLVVPIQQLPQQIGPILIYYLVYAFPSPSILSMVLMITGIALISTSGFILAKRQAALEEIK
jgi:multidrug transporter EmrE-like cation transporter